MTDGKQVEVKLNISYIINIFPTKRIYMKGVSKIKTYKKQGFNYTIKEIN